MKNIKYIFSVLCLASILFACEEDYERTPGGPVTTTPAEIHPLSTTSFVLTQSTTEGANPFLVRLSWDRARFSYGNGLPSEATDILYAIEAGVLGDEFSTVYPLGNTEVLYYDIYTEEMNDLILQIFGKSEEARSIELRVSVSYKDANGKEGRSYSDPTTLTLTPYVYVTPFLHPIAESFIALKEADDLLFEAKWNALNFAAIGAAQSEVKYALEVAIAGTNFKEKVELANTDKLTAPVEKDAIHAAIKTLLGKQTDEEVALEIRVKAVYGDKKEACSNVRSLNVVSYIAGPKVVKWKIVKGSWDGKMAIYVWGDGELFGGWPGKVLTPDEYGWYAAVIPEGFNANVIINNENGGKQIDLISPKENAQLNVDLDASTSSPASEWSVRLRWKQPNNEWGGNMAIYSWGGNPSGETFGGWPGKVVTANAEGWYSVLVAPGQSVGNAILNNNNGGIQFDVNIPILTDTDLQITGNSFTVITQ